MASTFWGYEAAEYLPVLQQKLEQSANVAVEKFKQLAAASSVTTSCQLIEEAYISTLAHASIGYDLLVTPQPKSQPDSVVEMEFQASDIVVGCACPTLVVPRTPAPAQVGTRIVIAWNDSRESSRAVRDALPLLARAEDVVVLSVHNPHHDRHDDQSLPEQSRH